MHMKKNTLLIFLIFTSLVTYAQQKFTVSGTISDSKNNETLIGVNIYVPNLKIGTTTNEYGFYSLTIPEGEHEFEISYVGYESILEMIILNDDSKNNFSLKEIGQELQEIVVSGKKGRLNIKTAEMSINKLSITAIKKMPVVMGEVDILKSLLLLPGVTNAGDGASGFNVRGGGADQNLILLDESPLFNTSHLFGYLSVFNPDVIKDLKLYKGGIPARFGGRASSVLDIHQKDGNSKGFHVSGGIGLISSRLLVEGPIVKDKASFLIGGRISYLKPLLELSQETADTSLSFYDLNSKFNYKINDENSLFLSGYFGRDAFALNKHFSNNYGNTTLNLRWNHLYSDQLFSNLSLVYSDYYYRLGMNVRKYAWDSGIKNYNIKYDFKNYISDTFTLNYGLNGIYYDFNPGTINGIGASTIDFKQLDKKYAFEPAVYVDAESQISEKIRISYGLRYSLFYRLGNSTVNYYANDNPVIFNSDLQIYEKAKPVSTKQFGRNEVIKNYNNLEPRFGISYQLNDDAAIKANYNRMVQYLQLISNTTSPTPIDIWTPSDNYIKPQIADQVALGYFKNISDGDYSVEVESYYKKIQNRLDYIDGADLIANDAVEQIILNGQMRSYGVEFMLKKNEGKLNGWISYTLSKSEQQTPGRTPEEIGINDGKWYNSAYDKTHNLAVTTAYNVNDKWSFGANFILQSGQPATYATSSYQYGDNLIPDYSLRNQHRLPLYHHLDISATLTPRKNKNRNWKGEWVFSIYNLYNRHNSNYIEFRYHNTYSTYTYGIVPSVNYNFKF
ncbi:TonB-dependent receptor [Flavobacterium hercynium]|uniref:isocitrate dehydrogenase (NADP(+)) n=1 Tax=Flavobacterium hercynium TaxID=387094 RepID=A0A226GZ60_9FLAO|nr:TonB-dependent receptor [Flavobacterium hercynium]OXA87272.1 collagen-binding protein [Flavobacterium hercynium]SMP19539.1 Outer membrane receptor proteins, mostly Fe transport [Flavobacterium hercynium]